MKTITKHLPNFLTCCNLACGIIGIVAVFQSQLHYATFLIWIACIFDFLDGFVARLVRAQSSIGKELDSLADMVTFGCLPALIIFKMIQNSNVDEFLPFIAIIMAVFSALRLAKFNIDTRQTDSFIGVPTPANALLVSSFPLIIYQDQYNLVLLQNPWVLAVLCIILSFLLVAELPLFALKFKNFSWKDNKLRFLFLLTSVILIILFQSVAIPIIILMYIIGSIFNKQKA